MFRNLFDFSNGSFIFKISDNMAMNSDGDMMMRISDNMAMDMETGEMNLTSSWDDDEEDDW